MNAAMLAASRHHRTRGVEGADVSPLRAVRIPSGLCTENSPSTHCRSGLTSISLTNSVTAIGVSAFEGASQLTSLVLPDSIVSLGTAAMEATGLVSVTIPDRVSAIPESLLANTLSLEAVVISDSVVEIGRRAFQ